MYSSLPLITPVSAKEIAIDAVSIMNYSKLATTVKIHFLLIVNYYVFASQH